MPSVSVCQPVYFMRQVVSPVWAYRKDPELNHMKSLEKAFLKGSNATCWMHIQQHYEYYHSHCKEAGIEEAEHCIPPEILCACDSKSKVLTQTKLKMVGAGELAPRQFLREGTLCTITKFIACDDQV